MIVNSVQESRLATIKPIIIIARSSTMFASRAIDERTKEERKVPVLEKHTTPMIQREESIHLD